MRERSFQAGGREEKQKKREKTGEMARRARSPEEIPGLRNAKIRSRNVLTGPGMDRIGLL